MAKTFLRNPRTTPFFPFYTYFVPLSVSSISIPLFLALTVYLFGGEAHDGHGLFGGFPLL